jgi:hypothetical protein
LRYTPTAPLDLRAASTISLSLLAENPSPYDFQNGSPWIRLLDTTTGGYFEYQYFEGNSAVEALNRAIGTWQAHRIPLQGVGAASDGWRRRTVGTVTLQQVSRVEIHADTWDAGFTMWVDGFGFDLPASAAGQAPTDITPSATSITENNPVDAVVASLSAVDPDGNGTATYRLVSGAGSNDNAAFAILGNELRAAQTFNAEEKGTYAIRIRAMDVDGLTVEKAFTINITDVNEPPTDIALSATSIAENNVVGTVVGMLSAVDPDAGSTFAYGLVSGSGSADNASFSVVGNELRAAQSFNRQTKASYAIRIRATDGAGLSFEKAFQLTVIGPLYQNPADPYDVNGEPGVTPLDVLLIINYINRNGSGPLPALGPSGPPPYVDVNGDDKVTPIDVLLVINYINTHVASGAEGERGPGVDAATSPLPPSDRSLRGALWPLSDRATPATAGLPRTCVPTAERIGAVGRRTASENSSAQLWGAAFSDDWSGPMVRLDEVLSTLAAGLT